MKRKRPNIHIRDKTKCSNKNIKEIIVATIIKLKNIFLI